MNAELTRCLIPRALWGPDPGGSCLGTTVLQSSLQAVVHSLLSAECFRSVLFSRTHPTELGNAFAHTATQLVFESASQWANPASLFTMLHTATSMSTQPYDSNPFDWLCECMVNALVSSCSDPVKWLFGTFAIPGDAHTDKPFVVKVKDDEDVQAACIRQFRQGSTPSIICLSCDTPTQLGKEEHTRPVSMH